MKLKITKICEAVLDTGIERQRISKAFRDDPETQKKLTELIDAVEEMNWKKAQRLLSGKWWNGRLEFIGELKLKSLDFSNSPARGFNYFSDYTDLVSMMNQKEESGFQIKVEPFLEKK